MREKTRHGGPRERENQARVQADQAGRALERAKTRQRCRLAWRRGSSREQNQVRKHLQHWQTKTKLHLISNEIVRIQSLFWMKSDKNSKYLEYLEAQQWFGLNACLLACLPACLLACLLANLLACLLACFLACLLACLLAYVPPLASG